MNYTPEVLNGLLLCYSSSNFIDTSILTHFCLGLNLAFVVERNQFDLRAPHCGTDTCSKPHYPQLYALLLLK